MIAGVGGGGDFVFDAEAAGDCSGCVEGGVGGETRAGVGKGVGKAEAGQVVGGGADVCEVAGEAAESAFQSCGPGV